MLTRFTLSTALVFCFALNCTAQQQPDSKPIELEALKASLGVWDAEIEVWAAGPDADPVKFKGVETNRAYGEYWIASDFDSEFGGQTVKVHSIVGYDLDEKKLVGKVIDHGPYAASMTGTYDPKSKTTTWQTKAKSPTGQPMLQKTLLTQKSPHQRILELQMPGKNKDEFTKFMKITFTKRKSED